jgi:CheY-like chemotaxis protein
MRTEQTILLIEDDLVDTMTITRALKYLQVKNPVDNVTDGERALTYLRGSTKPLPGLILLDLNMPRMNGLEFLEHVKADPALRAIPVIILTTSRLNEDWMAAFDKSVAGYIIKPVLLDQFVEVMRKISDYWLSSEPTPN